MFLVYANAHVTLAALYGTDPTCGLRDDDVDSHMEIGTIMLGETNCQLITKAPHIYSPGWSHIHTYGPTHADPLLRRGWCFQERIVSKRVLFFTGSELVYECMQECVCECGTTQDLLAPGTTFGEDFPQKKNLFDIKTFECALKASQKDASSASESRNRHEIQGQLNNTDLEAEVSNQVSFDAKTAWRAIAKSYAGLAITKESDRLPALSALAELHKASRPSSSRDLAGAWSDSICEDLCWSVKWSNTRYAGKYSLTPSWSWASVFAGPQLDWPFFDDESPLSVLAQVIEARCEHAPGQPYGTPTSCTLLLKAQCMTCKLQGARRSLNNEGVCLFSADAPVTKWEECSGRFIYIDKQAWLDEDPREHEVHLLEVLEGEGLRYHLILHQEPYTSRFFRIGVVASTSDGDLSSFCTQNGIERVCEIV